MTAGRAHAETVQVSTYRPQLDRAALAELPDRLDRTRAAPDLGSGWERGMPADWLQRLLRDWRAHDLEGLRRRLDALPHRRAQIGDQTVHLLLAEGRGPAPLALVLTHGWPGSFLEYLPVIARLADPAAHGGDPADAFTVIVPSLPGYGFSAPPPPSGRSAREVAALWHRLLTEGLGHARYVAHGSDLGAGVTAWLARDHPAAVAGIHLATPGLAAPEADRTPAEERFAQEVAAWTAEEGGYLHEHATKPATLAAALADSPAGMAAWIVEKIVAWSSLRADGSPAFDRELLLDTLTLYWATDTIGTSLLPYWAYRHIGEALPVDDPTPVPTSVSIFGGERVPFPKPPRALAQRYYTVARWAEHGVGGHFPSVAEPELLTQSLRDAFRPLRG